MIAASSDALEDAQKTIATDSITYPVAYGLDPVAFGESHAAYYSDDGEYLHATGFLINPAGVIEIAVYSSGAIGRLAASHVVGMVQWYKSQS